MARLSSSNAVTYVDRVKKLTLGLMERIATAESTREEVESDDTKHRANQFRYLVPGTRHAVSLADALGSQANRFCGLKRTGASGSRTCREAPDSVGPP